MPDDGMPDDGLPDGAVADDPALRRERDAREAVEQLLLDGPRRYTRLQVAAMAGMPPARTQRLWRALGFPDAADDDVAFTDADIAALGVLSALIDSGFVGPDTEATIARAMGQSLSRLADWQTDMLADVLARRAAAGAGTGRPDGAVGVDPAEAVDAARTLLPLLRSVQDYVWRRHLVANADRMLAVAGPADRRELAVGFVDLVGYTSRSRGMARRELGAMVEDFESTAAEVIARHAGRVVKTVGDGVLYTVATAVDAAEIALDLPPAWDAPDRPPLRVGVAYGPVLTRLGDVFSPVVNLASRLTSLGRPGAVLADRELARRLRRRPAYRVRPLPPVPVRGYDSVRPWQVRRRPPAEEDNAFERMLDEIADDVLDEEDGDDRQ
ncbi:adenylate/guanylate cyclase domain-containing protein [Geodermatophilus sp. YIM 151500]|uniref:adenylate/guanylate cyclase domain-containing protein n=1 Tax=Geodermatophilus sp. YIM 151500 TaxID=2984531 RepID=UPI0021E3FE3A|nr:adenylate/guanylate cyclase domain-containing protein [Geodermatophilus sp. YIM 151500]MCV2488732.1 adenylate/guanylate cyclase domain-containing protein [Geodermatophilus sp. YIM 151500]